MGENEPHVDLGAVTAPSGVLVLGMASWTDHWPRLGGGSLSERATAAASAGGGARPHWLCELVAVPRHPTHHFRFGPPWSPRP